MTIRVLAVAVLFILISFQGVAQTEKKSNVHIGFTYPISSNGYMAKDYSNSFSAHAIAGISQAEEAFCMAGIAHIVMADARGFIATGVLNLVHDSVTGFQASGFLNYVKNHINGFQAAGFVNMAGSVRGAQAAGFANLTQHHVQGPQIAGFVNIAQTSATQTAGFANVADSLCGPQVAGFLNIASIANSQIGGFMNVGTVAEATQVAGFINIANTTPVQVAGFTNIAKKAEAAQVAGFVNVAGEVNTQVAGFINIARKVKGVQVAGFINIADSSDHPIGLINIIGNGEKAVGVTVDESLNTLLSLRSGGRVLYGIVGGGYNLSRDEPFFALEAGLGAHLNMSKSFRINLEASCISVTDFITDGHFKSSIRVLPGFNIGKHLEIFAGPTLNMSTYNDSFDKQFVSNYLATYHYGDTFWGLHLGAIGGIQLKF